jgi:hypothetical protein
MDCWYRASVHPTSFKIKSINNNMTTETLKLLIEHEFDKVSTISEFKSEVMRLIDLFEMEHKNSSPWISSPNEPEEVMYAHICPCNPKNGGSGVCGCMMSNKMVKNPKKYGGDFYK